MCKWGNTKQVLVNIPAYASYTGYSRWEYKEVDSCLVDIVEALNASGVLTCSSCCGHSHGPGDITLQDGRVILIENADDYYLHSCRWHLVQICKLTWWHLRAYLIRVVGHPSGRT